MVKTTSLWQARQPVYATSVERWRRYEPWLGELIAWLAFGDARHGEALMLKKAGVVWLEGSSVPGGMTVRAMMPPKLLRELA